MEHFAAASPHPIGCIYFVSFIVTAVFVVTNLFLAVVINNLDKVKSEQAHAADAASEHHVVLARIEGLKAELNELERVLRSSTPQGRT